MGEPIQRLAGCYSAKAQSIRCPHQKGPLANPTSGRTLHRQAPCITEPIPTNYCIFSKINSIDSSSP